MPYEVVREMLEMVLAIGLRVWGGVAGLTKRNYNVAEADNLTFTN